MLIGLHSWPPPSASSSEESDATGAQRNRPHPRATSPPHHHRQPWASRGPRHDLGYGREETAGTKQWPCNSCRHCAQCRRRLVEASQVVEGLVKELFAGSLSGRAHPCSERREQRPRTWHEGHEVRDEVPGHNWHFRHFDPRFRLLKEAIKKTEEEALDVVQGGHSKFILAMPRRNF